MTEETTAAVAAATPGSGTAGRRDSGDRDPAGAAARASAAAGHVATASPPEPADSLMGTPGEAGADPLDRGVAPPERWSAGVKFGSTADEQASGESLDQLEDEHDGQPDQEDGVEDRGPPHLAQPDQ